MTIQPDTHEAKQTLTLEEAKQALRMDHKTLQKHMRAAGIRTTLDPSDKRRRLLTAEQVERIRQRDTRPRARENDIELLRQEVVRLEETLTQLQGEVQAHGEEMKALKESANRREREYIEDTKMWRQTFFTLVQRIPRIPSAPNIPGRATPSRDLDDEEEYTAGEE